MSYFGIPIRNGLPIGLGSVAPLASGGGSPFSPLSLFSGGAPGAWYDPSDFSTLFQDSAGTTPVTAVEQPVGRMLDKSGYGNHAFQATSASRPVLSARYNLLTKTEQFDDAVWLKSGVTVSANAIAAPNGSLTADKIIETVGTVQFGVYVQTTLPNSSTNTYSIYAKAGERTWMSINTVDGANRLTWFNLADGSIGTQNAGHTANITPVGDGWYRCSVTYTRSTAAQFACFSPAIANNGYNYTGDGVSGIYIWGAQLESAT